MDDGGCAGHKWWEEGDGCKFCFVEYMLDFKSRYLWLLVLKYQQRKRKFRRSMAYLKSLKYNVARLEELVGEIVSSVSGKENI